MIAIRNLRRSFGADVAVDDVSFDVAGGEVHIAGASIPLILISVAVAVGGIALGRRMYLARPATEPLERLGWFYKLLVNKYYLDDLYYRGIVYPVRDGISKAMYWVNQNVIDGAVNGAAATARGAARGLYGVIDQKVIDGAVNGIGRVTASIAERTRRLQTGYVRNYAAVFLVGVVLVVSALMARETRRQRRDARRASGEQRQPAPVTGRKPRPRKSAKPDPMALRNALLDRFKNFGGRRKARGVSLRPLDPEIAARSS